MSTARCCHIVTPVYRDVESFLILRERALATVREAEAPPTGVAFYVIDDTAGRDESIAQLRSLPDVTVITPPFNLGHQRAIVAGLRVAADRFADDDHVVTMDSDGEDRPEDIPRLLSALDATPDPWAVVVARRTRRHASASFRLLYVGFVLLFRVLTGRVVRSGNFAAFRGRYARTMLSHPSFDLCYSSSLIALERAPVYVPCARGKRYAGESRMGPLNLLMHGVRMMMPLADRIAVRALALSGLLAALTLTLALVLAGLRLTGVIGSLSYGLPLMVVGALGAGLALLTFLVLFTGFVQTSGLAMGRVHERAHVDD